MFACTFPTKWTWKLLWTSMKTYQAIPSASHLSHWGYLHIFGWAFNWKSFFLSSYSTVLSLNVQFTSWSFSFRKIQASCNGFPGRWFCPQDCSTDSKTCWSGSSLMQFMYVYLSLSSIIIMKLFKLSGDLAVGNMWHWRKRHVILNAQGLQPWHWIHAPFFCIILYTFAFIILTFPLSLI